MILGHVFPLIAFVVFSTSAVPIAGPFASFSPVNSECDCLDWYGDCRKRGENWIDDETWKYECQGSDRADALFMGCEIQGGGFVKVGENRSINDLWHSCSVDDIALRIESEPHCFVDGTLRRIEEIYRKDRFQWKCLETGQWVTGCYYSNETNDGILMNIGETVDDGIIHHVCQRYEDNPGLIQYFVKIDERAGFQAGPSHKHNHNLPELGDHRITEKIIKWTHDQAEHFLANENIFRKKVRYLPSSIEEQTTQSNEAA